MTASHAPTEPIWPAADGRTVQIIDQRRLPHEVVIRVLSTATDAVEAIVSMMVRGAPLIGVTAAYGVFLGAHEALDRPDPRAHLAAACDRLAAARPTAVNLMWAVNRMRERLAAVDDPRERVSAARAEADRIADEERERCRAIGEHGVALIEAAARGKTDDSPVNVLTHCNAGWLACVAHGTATAPIYAAAARGIPVHVWVDETRPLNQGARLTAWELGRAGVPHTVIPDNTGGHLMQHGMVDLVIVGTDRTTRCGDVANKIGTYLKALAARDNGVPFYVALPSSTFDWQVCDGVAGIPIETRDPEEVHVVEGHTGTAPGRVRVTPTDSPAVNYAFDVTPARLVTGFITERGICAADEAAIAALFDEAPQGA